MHWFEVLQLIGLGFICIAYPIILFASIWMLPIYIKISYFIWVIGMITWMSLGKKKKIKEYIIPICIMVFAFTCVYASGFSSDEFSNDAFLILLSPTLSTPAFCYIGYKLAEYRENKKLEQMKWWIKELNDSYKRTIAGINKICGIINKAYSDDNQVEKIVRLLEQCYKNDLLLTYKRKSIDKNENIISDISSIGEEYYISLELKNNTLGEILSQMEKMKRDYRIKIRPENEIRIDLYNSVKSEYLTVVKDKCLLSKAKQKVVN